MNFLATQYNTMAIVISETWLDESIHNAELSISGFTIYRVDRNNRMRGGVCIYVRNEHSVSPVTSFSNSVVEILILKNDILNGLMIGIYRPPDTKVYQWSNALGILNHNITSLQRNGIYGDIYIYGDMNFHLTNWNSANSTIYECSDSIKIYN